MFLSKSVLALSVLLPLIVSTPKTIRVEELQNNSASDVVAINLPGDLAQLPKDPILRALILCESGGRVMARNPSDRDGTPSYGILQFKPGTFAAWGREYGLLPRDIERAEIMNLIYDPHLQMEIVSKKISENKHNKKWWLTHFPACAERHRFWDWEW